MQPKFRIYTEYYTAKTPERQVEIDTCLKNNLENKQVDEIYLFVDNAKLLLDLKFEDPEEKLMAVVMDSRPSVFDFMKKAALVSSENDFNSFQNSDIYWTEENIELVKQKLEHDMFFALTRWDIDEFGSAKLLDRVDSQDTWVYIGGRILNTDTSDLVLGTPGNDNALAYRAEQSGLRVLNPCQTIKTFHVHLTGIRNYVDQNGIVIVPVVPPPYKVLTHISL